MIGLIPFKIPYSLLDIGSGAVTFITIMNGKRLEELIDESIRLELNAARLYLLFAEALDADVDFWKQLAAEEEHHAELLRVVRESFVKEGSFPHDLVSVSIELLAIGNATIDAMIEKVKSNPPTRVEACEAALIIEQDIGESYYSNFIEQATSNPAESVFRILNKGDQVHEERIQTLLKSLMDDEMAVES